MRCLRISCLALFALAASLTAQAQQASSSVVLAEQAANAAEAWVDRFPLEVGRYVLEWAWLLFLLPLPWLLGRLLPALWQRLRGQGAVSASAGEADVALKMPAGSALASMSEFVTVQSRQQTQTTALQWLLFAILWLSLLLAASRPVWLGEPIRLEQRGRDLMLAIDLSGSMRLPDISPSGKEQSRWQVVQRFGGEFVRGRSGDRVGLILFGSQAYLQAPLSYDTPTVAQLLGEADLGLAGQDTAIGDAIMLAIKRLQERPSDQRVLVLISDGENTAGEVAPEQALSLAKTAQVKIYTVGIGNSRWRYGRRIRNAAASLDEALLKQLAADTGGQYFRAQSAAGLQRIYQELEQLEPAVEETHSIRPKHSLLHWPLLLALLSLLLLLACKRWPDALAGFNKATVGNAAQGGQS